MSTQQIRSLSHRRRILGGTYAERVLAYSPLIYFPLNELSGTNAANLGSLGASADGTYTGATLNNAPGPDGKDGAPLFDGTDDNVNIYTAALATAFDGDEGTLMLWQKVYSAAVWTDDTYRFGLILGYNTSNRIQLLKGNDADSNELVASRRASNTNKKASTAVTPTAWFHHAITWSTTADEQRNYYAGSQYGTTQTSLGSWTGTLADTWCYIGAYNNGTLPWYGWLAHAALFDYPMTATQIADLAII